MTNYTQKAILETFEQMLAEMPFDKVTVAALVKRCQISPNTFYYHFRDIYDLLNVWLAEQKQVYLKSSEGPEDWPSRLKAALKKLRANSRIVYHVFDSISRQRIERFVFVVLEKEFYRELKTALSELDIPEETLRDLASFCCYSTFGFFLKFLWDHMDADADQAVDRLFETFSGVTAYVAAKSKAERVFGAPADPAPKGGLG